MKISIKLAWSLSLTAETGPRQHTHLTRMGSSKVVFPKSIVSSGLVEASKISRGFIRLYIYHLLAYNVFIIFFGMSI